MARKIFFSFHYERDAWRAGQVRNANVVSDEDEYGFIDAVDWEAIKKKGNAAIKRWIDDQLENTSVTAVLIGAETADREWVQFEIQRSWNRGNGVVGVRIHNIKDQDQEADTAGRDPFEDFKLPDGTRLSSVCKTYDWVNDDGRANLGKWADAAAKIRCKYTTSDEITGPAKDKAVQASTMLRSSASAAFTPRSPWSPNYVEPTR
jgi:antiphage defense system Thoeris ThsB-like protein